MDTPESMPAATGRPPARAALGSLAAVAALASAGNAGALPPPTSDVRVSTSIVNTSISNGLQLDIDGNGTADFSIVFANSGELRINGLASNRSGDSGTSGGFGTNFTQAFPLATSIGSAAQWATLTALANTYVAGGPGTNFYAGVEFGIGAATHYGWIQFSIPSNSSPWTGATAVAAAWENNAGVAINAGAVPAPGAIAVVVGAGLLRSRRRR